MAKNFWKALVFNKILFLFLTAGLLLRLFLSIQIYSGDVNNHISWAKDSVNFGFSGMYEREFPSRYGTMTPTYPPITLFLFTIFYSLFNFLYKLSWSLNLSFSVFPSGLINFFEDQDTLPAFLKLPAIFADLGIALFVFMFVKKFVSNRKWPLIGASLVLFNPAFFYNSAYWGQIESLPLFFILASFYFLLYTKKLLISALFLIVALLTKQTSIIFVPVYALAFYNKFSLRDAIKALTASTLFFWLFFFPFYQKGNLFLFPFSTYLNKIQTGSGSDYVTDHAFNFWAVVSGFGKIPDSTAFLFGIPFSFWGYAIFISSFLVILYTMHIRKCSPFQVLFGAGLIGFSAFLFLTRMHERYLEQALPFLLLISVIKVRYLWTFIILSLFYLVNLYHNWWAPRIDLFVNFLSNTWVINFFIFAIIAIFLLLQIQSIRKNLIEEE